MGIAYHGKTLKDQETSLKIMTLRKRKVYSFCLLSGSLMLYFLAVYSSLNSKKSLLF